MGPSDGMKDACDFCPSTCTGPANCLRRSGRWAGMARPPPTPRPSHGAGYCKGCRKMAWAGLDEADLCADCRPVQQVARATGGPTWGDALPADYLPPRVR